MKRLCLVLPLLLVACGGGEGSVEMNTWGEAFIEEGIAQSEFADGWSASFDRFLITLGDVSFGHADGDRTELTGMAVYDLAQPGPHAVGSFETLEARTWDDVGYRMGLADESTVAHATATADDLALMQDGGYAVYVEGHATRDDVTKTFRWGFTQSIRYSECVDVSGGQELSGVVVSGGAVVDAQMTIHGDHFFYDDLVSGEAALRFDNLADADADDDGEVTLSELAAVPLANLPGDRGPYAVGSSEVNDLAAYVSTAVQTLGHFNGEGHCAVTVE